MKIKTIPNVSRPDLGIEELEEVKKVFESGWLGMGSVVLQFEKMIQEYIGAKNIVAVNTGTSAIHMALDAVGLQKGDEVIVPSFTFCAGVQAIIMTGARPVFCDVNQDDYNIDIKDVERKITSKTKVIMCVHFSGNACEMDALLKIGRENNIIIVEDAAHAFGSTYKGKKIGSFGDIACFSFDPIKTITCGEGGAVVFNNDKLAESIKCKRILGIDNDSWNRQTKGRAVYEVVTNGYRYHMSNINAAVGIAQLKKIDFFIERKRKIISIYQKGLSECRRLSLPDIMLNETAPFNFVIRVLDNKRDELMEYLKEFGISTGIHYPANHTQPFFKKYFSPLPNTELLSKQVLSLPLFTGMEDTDAEQVIKKIKDFFAENDF